MDSLIHIANGLLLLSLSLKDILWLRLMNAAASVAFIAYFYLLPEPLMAPIYWNLLFMAVNAYQIYLVLLSRRPVRLSLDEQWLHRTAFASLSPREFHTLIQPACWEEAGPQERVLARGDEADRVLVLATGGMRAEVDGQQVAAIAPGQFVGEMSFVSGSRTSADVVTTVAARFLAWPASELQALIDEHPTLGAAVQCAIGRDLVRKLSPG